VDKTKGFQLVLDYASRAGLQQLSLCDIVVDGGRVTYGMEDRGLLAEAAELFRDHGVFG
jgi:hypothetical protein